MATADSTPTYRDVVGFPGYRVGDDGSVWSNRTGRILKPFRAGKGYQAIQLSRGGRMVRVYLHWLVAEAFLGLRPPGFDVCHNDGDRMNNRPENLRYDTRRGNLADRDRHGTHQRGQQNPGASLTDAQAAEIRALRAAGYLLRSIAERFGVNESTVSRIANGTRRKGVSGETKTS